LNSRLLTSRNPQDDVWRFLKYFLHGPIAEKRIREIRNLTSHEQKANVKKQAEQISYCIRQAEEYFDAAETVSLITKPLLLYYGAVSLSQALVLLRRDGQYSFDFLRKHRRHQHHGLKGFGFENLQPDSVEYFLAGLSCQVNTKNESNQDIPWGHFPNFYESLKPAPTILSLDVGDNRNQFRLKSETPAVSHDSRLLLTLVDTRFRLLQLASFLPDLYFIFRELNIPSSITRIRVDRFLNKVYRRIPLNELISPGPDINFLTDEIEHVEDLSNFYINDIDEGAQSKLLVLYRKLNPSIEVVSKTSDSLHLKLITIRKENDKPEQRFYPDILSDYRGRQYLTLDPNNYVHEAASLFMILYLLGMLARYYPDIWVRIITKNAQIAQVLEKLLDVATLRFPILVLDQMTDTKHYVSANL